LNETEIKIKVIKKLLKQNKFYLISTKIINEFESVQVCLRGYIFIYSSHVSKSKFIRNV